MNPDVATEAPGRFITFEGIDGAGKSSHLDGFAQGLRERGFEVLVTREPGGPPIAERLRELLLNEPMEPLTEALLAFAARREHLRQTIEPALSAGRWVLCDRFTDSTFAYQGGGRGLDWALLRQLEQWVHPGRQPDCTILFDLAPQEAARRRGQVRAPDRFEQEAVPFFERVRAAYRRRVDEAPQRFVIVDSHQSVDAIRARLRDLIDAFE